MRERNEQMSVMLAADAPAARDLAFEIAVMARIEQRRYVRAMTRNIVLAAGLAVLLALLAPQLDWAAALAGSWSFDVLQLTGNTVPMLALLVAAACAWYFRPAEN